MGIRNVFILIGLLFFLSYAPGQEVSQWPFQHIDKKSGLSNSAITTIYMDRNDNVWFGSWDGLNRYDGSAIFTYKPDPLLKGSISNNVIREILEDRYGSLWIVTHSGINKFNPDNDSFEPFFANLNLPFQEYNLKACVGPDSSVWVGINGWGIGSFSKLTGIFQGFKPFMTDTSWFKSVIGIGSHNSYLYVLGHNGKIACIHDHKIIYSFNVDPKSILQQNKFFVLNHKYFLAIPTENNNLNLYDLTLGIKEPQRIHLNSVRISCISLNLKHDALWVGTESGNIYKISGDYGKFIIEGKDSYIPLLSQKKLKILSITETNQNILWVGTDGDGVYKFLTKERPFYSITYGQTDHGQLSQSIVRCIYDDKDKLYIGTRGGGLNIISIPNKQTTKIFNSATGLSNNAVLSINKDLKGNIWIGIDGEGIDMMEAGTKRIFHFPRDFAVKNSVNFASVYTICVDSNNDLWLGTSGYGVIHLKVQKLSNGKYNLVRYQKIDSQNSIMNSNIVYSIIEDKNNIFWFGSRLGGIYKYNAEHADFEDLQKINSKNLGLSNNDILCLCKDSKNHLWIGTSGGLNCLYLDSKQYKVKSYTQYNGLPNNSIHGILEDQFGKLWISTNNGLSLFDTKDQSFKNFDWNDGLQNNEFTDGAAFKSHFSNTLYFGGIDGLDIVYPDKLDSSNFFPKLAITELQVHNVIIYAGDKSNLLKQHINFTNNLTFNYKQNFISFHFTALDFWNKQRCKYAYYLENYDKDWIYINKQSFVNLINIPPGKYKLHIKYTNEYGSWNSDIRTISIHITPPFLATYLAFAIYILLIIAFLSLTVFFIKKRVKNRKIRTIEKIKRVHEEELNAYKLQFFTNIAHEFRTPLTLIMGPVATLLKRTLDDSIKKPLTTIYKNSLRLQKLIQELIEFRKIETGSAKLEVSEKDLNAFTLDIVNIFQEYANERGIHIEFIPCSEPVYGYIDSNKVEKILINLISNAIKYTYPQGNIVVKLSIFNKSAKFEISDTGVGMPAEIIDKIFDPFFHGSESFMEIEGIAKGTGIGLSLTKSLVEVHKGSIEVKSTLGMGSKFSFTIPIDISSYDVVVSPKDHSNIIIRLKEKINTEFESSEYEIPELKVSDAIKQAENSSKEYQLLIVDDNPEVLSMLKDIMPDKYGINLANSGTKALEILDNYKIDLVISDVMMPDMDGLTLCYRIKNSIETSHIPVILLTAKGEIEHRIEGLQVGADSYIPKPFHPDHLLVRIEKLINIREILRNKFKNLPYTSEEELHHGLNKADQEFLVKISQFIKDEVSNPDLDADHISLHIGMGKTSLYKKIKSITGLTPHLLINQYRLKHAAFLLKNSGMNVSEVIYETGFNSRSYFYKSFHEFFHCSPKDFK